MTTFSDDFQALALPELLANFGEEVLYLCGADWEKATGILGAEEVREEKDNNGRRTKVRRLEVTVTTDPDDATYGGIADVNIRGKVQVNGREYAIIDTKGAADGFISLVLERRETIERSTPRYRQNQPP